MITRHVPSVDRVIRPSGRFVMRAYRRGVLFDEIIDNNLVVDGIKDVLAHLLGAGTAAKIVTQIGFGSDGTVPVVGNNSLATPYLRAMSAVSYPVAGQVQFDWELDGGESNGLAIREWGLFTTSGILVARKSRASAILKEADVTLTGSWIIVFNN